MFTPDRTAQDRDWHERQTREVKRDFPHSRKVDMPPDFEQLARETAKQGFLPWLNFTGKEWHCTLMAGVDVVPGTVPPAEGTGESALSAIQAAIVRKNEITRR